MEEGGEETPPQPLSSPAMWRFVLGEDKRFGTVWDAFPQEAGNNAKTPMKDAGRKAWRRV